MLKKMYVKRGLQTKVEFNELENANTWFRVHCRCAGSGDANAKARGCASLDEYLIKMSVRCWQVSSWNDLFAVPTSSWIPLCKKRLGPKYVQLPSGTNPAKPLASNVYSEFFHFDGLGMPPAMLHVWLSVRPFRTLLLKYWICIYIYIIQKTARPTALQACEIYNPEFE